MKAIRTLIFLLTITASCAFSKPFDEKKNEPKLYKQFEQAEFFLKHENYTEALAIYEELFYADPSNFNLCYKLGLCYLKERKQKAKAVYYLEKASYFTSPTYKEGLYKERKAPVLIYKLLGAAYHQNAKFDLAIAAYGKYKKILTAAKVRDYVLIEETNRDIEICYNAKKLVAKPVHVKIENMGKNVNTPYPDYSPVFTADQVTMIFTSGRPTNVGGGKTYDGGKYFEDIYTSTKITSEWSEAINIGSPINTVENEASVCISADGQEILIYKDDKGDGNIYSTTLKGSVWSTPVKLNSHINSKSWEPSAFLSANGNILYFTSDRPGGFGGRDIYKSDKMRNGNWGRAINLGNSINSKYDEDAPFLHHDGVTLYFSSTGHKTMGGFDIFESTLQSNGSWSEPTNVGYPINSPGDDVFYVASPDKKIAYFTSVREGGFGEKDNYIITFPDVKEVPLALQKGFLLDKNQKPAKNAKITVTDNQTEEVVGVYYPNSETGKYIFILTPGKSHNISYEAEDCLFYSENNYTAKEKGYSEITKTIILSPITEGSKVTLNNVFFDFDKSELRSYSEIELNKIFDFMTDHPKLLIEISGYTDSKGKDDYNSALSMARAMSIVKYLTDKGIEKCRMVAIGYGKSDPVAPNQNADGSDSPDGRQLNRRVELKIIKAH